MNAIAEKVPSPKLKNFGDFVAFRYEEKTIQQAIIQKLARKVSTLDAARVLLNNGFLQEQASLQRILDELREDIEFLVLGFHNSDHEKSLHRDYLDSFYEEEFDADTAIDSTQKRPMLPRKKIRAYLASAYYEPLDPSSATELFRTISKTYSGYVHGASPQIMDMYGGNPGHFHMRGMKGTPIYEVHKDDLWNYFYRSICVFSMAAMVLDEQDCFRQCKLLQEFYEQEFPDRIGKV